MRKNKKLLSFIPKIEKKKKIKKTNTDKFLKTPKLELDDSIF